MMTNAQPYHRPKRSQTAPITSLEKILRDTEVTPALPTSPFVRLRLSRMMGTSGAAANVDTKQVKKEIQERSHVLMWGLAKENSLNTLALCSESTGKSNFAVGSVEEDKILLIQVNLDLSQSLKVQLKQQQFDFAFLVLYGIVWRCRSRTMS